MSRTRDNNVALARLIKESLPEAEECLAMLLSMGLKRDVAPLCLLIPLCKEASARLLLPVEGKVE